MAKPKLTLIEPGTKPARKLGRCGTDVWRAIMADYEIADAAGIELLTLICQSVDRAEALREQIDADGEMIRTRGGIRAHPALQHEAAARAFIARSLVRLGVTSEAIKPIGRPGQDTGWRGHADE